MKNLIFPLVAFVLFGFLATPLVAAESLVMKTVLFEDENENPEAAGKAAGEKLLNEMGATPLKLVLVSESFEGPTNKDRLLKGLCAVLPKEKIFGLSTYGSFTEKQAIDGDALTLIGIGGDAISIQTAIQRDLGVSKLKMESHETEIRTKLLQSGEKLAASLAPTAEHRLSVLLVDAHSPKCGFFVEGMQTNRGKDVLLLGGSANKNPEENHVYYQGERVQDAAVLLNLSGKFNVSLAGRFANTGETILATAGDTSAEAVGKMKGKPVGMIAFSCAGRKSKLDDIGDEAVAIKKHFADRPIFGCFCAGEIGPTDKSVEKTDAYCCGSGWCLMLAVFSE